MSNEFERFIKFLNSELPVGETELIVYRPAGEITGISWAINEDIYIQNCKKSSVRIILYAPPVSKKLSISLTINGIPIVNQTDGEGRK